MGNLLLRFTTSTAAAPAIQVNPSEKTIPNHHKRRGPKNLVITALARAIQDANCFASSLWETSCPEEKERRRVVEDRKGTLTLRMKNVAPRFPYDLRSVIR